jgi:hypothetical protein
MANQKEEIKSIVEQNKPLQVRVRLIELINSNPTLDNYMYAEKIYKQIAKELNLPVFTVSPKEEGSHAW